VAILLADFFNLPVAVLHADYQVTGKNNVKKAWLTVLSDKALTWKVFRQLREEVRRQVLINDE